MKPPDWQSFPLVEGVLREVHGEGDRLTLWLAAEQDAHYRYWERVTTVARGEITATRGLCTTAIVSIRARQSLGGLLGELWNRLSRSHKQRVFQIPGGAVGEQCGERRDDLMLAWPEAHGDTVDEARIISLWPEMKRIQKLGQNLYLLTRVDSLASGPAAGPEPTSTSESPRGHAEAALAAARAAGSREQEATALTDLGVVQLNERDPQGAMASLDKALNIARELGDIGREIDVVGNLGMALLAIRHVESARVLFREELAHSRATTNRFAEKIALEHLGISSWTLRDFNGALGWFNQALTLARQVGDRYQEANLLWHVGVQHAELGQRELAIAVAEESVALFKTLGRPQAAAYGAYLQKYRMGITEEAPAPSAPGVTVEHSPQSYLGGSMVASVMAGQASASAPSTKGTSGPGLLRMAMSAAKAVAGFAGSGFQTTPADIQKKRLETCRTCEHHTGVRCRICGCFTNVKSRLLHENCPIGKWPA